MSKVEEQFGAFLRRHRKRAGLSQAQLAERIERQTNAVQRLESGETAPTFETLVRLSNALEVDIRDFFGIEHYAAQADRSDPLNGIVKQLLGLSDEELEAVDELIAAGLKLRR